MPSFPNKVSIPCLNTLSPDNWPVMQLADPNLDSITAIGIRSCNCEGWEASQPAVSKLENRKPAVYSAWEPGTLLAEKRCPSSSRGSEWVCPLPFCSTQALRGLNHVRAIDFIQSTDANANPEVFFPVLPHPLVKLTHTINLYKHTL